MNFNIKIADFGLAKFIDSQNYQMTSYMGTFVGFWSDYSTGWHLKLSTI
jgi:hypothetical protein